MEVTTVKDVWIPGPLGKLEIRIDKVNVDGSTIHKVVIASISMGGEAVYASPSMTIDEALELYDVMLALYSK